MTFSNPSLARTAEILSDGIDKLTGIKLSVKQSSKTKNCINLSVDASNTLLLQDHKTYGVSPKVVASLPSATQTSLPDERYTINITKKGIEIIGASSEAVFRGCSTLLQLCNQNSQPSTLNAQLIKDAPSFAWRGLSIDISRCLIPANDIKTVIDMMALYKLNVLHLHLNDNQGWRIEIKGYLELTKVGGYVENDGKEGGYLTQEQYKDIINYYYCPLNFL